MGEASGILEKERALTHSGDLIDCLRNESDSILWKQCLEQFKLLESKSDADFEFSESSVQEYQEKIDSCKQKTDAAKFEVVADSEFEMLQKELAEELWRESFLVITADIDDLENQRVSVEERRQSWRKLDKHYFRAQMKLSMYASVTNVIPKLNEPSTISGYIVEREKKIVENFEFDPVKMTPYGTCTSIWKMINL
ncbi:hypothetical protein DCAR_0415401 [Daucus carota subsp. sativus]|uniref:Uncharacterized protein n=1 Tax=Daucus carota subsp. sativus TaxID=79200 RepID=A0AAF0WW88_DAUCS|nr:hypothetical protein DCAR_0415401 [Daucus carota subsp. sativus]